VSATDLPPILSDEEFRQNQASHSFGGPADSQNAPPSDQASDKKTKATLLVDLVLHTPDVRLWHTPQGDPWITFPTDGGPRNYTLRGKDASSWLSRLYYKHHQHIPSDAAIREAVRALEGKALYEGDEVGTTDESDTEDKSDTQAVRLIRMVEESYDLVQTTLGATAVVPKNGPNIVRPMRGGSPSLSSELAQSYFVRFGKTCSQTARTEAFAVLDGRAQCLPRTDVFLRYAPTPEGIAVDLGMPDSGRAVLIRPNAWEVVDTAPVPFTRTALTLPMPEPVRGGRIEQLRDLLNLTDDAWHLLVAWLVAAVIPDIPHPILFPRGWKGTAKSTGSEFIAQLLDPSAVPLRKPPKDDEAWITAATGSHVVAIDNVSRIPEWFSDELCRAATGTGDVRRKLYTDADLVTFAFRRVVILNTIALNSPLRDDLADRLLPLDLEPIEATRRIADSEIRAKERDARPYVLAGLFDLVSQVLAVLPSVQCSELDRMADFTKVVATVDQCRGTNALGTYRELLDNLEAEVAESDEVISRLIAFLRGDLPHEADAFGDLRPLVRGPLNGTWKGTASELLTAITPAPRPKNWPGNGRWLSSRIDRNAAALRAAGFAFERDKRDKERVLHFTPITS
jgi:hypothetical protein